MAGCDKELGYLIQQERKIERNRLRTEVEGPIRPGDMYQSPAKTAREKTKLPTYERKGDDLSWYSNL